MLKEISIKDKTIFERFLSLRDNRLSGYNFTNIFIWSGLFKIYWDIIDECLCVFFKDGLGCFMYLAPLGKNYSSGLIKRCFGIMDGFNQNKAISRIENVQAGDLAFYRALGYACQRKFSDYLCKRKELVELKGNKFKSKRACINYFYKHYSYDYLVFSLRDKAGCLKLYERWFRLRKDASQDSIYQGMLEDNYNSLKVLLNHYRSLNSTGRIVKIDAEVSAFTFGFKLNPDTFCILYEITDLSIKGLAQFIFNKFCRELEGYQYINIMDDSGLDNLRRVKLSYKPFKVISSYIIKRKDVS